MQLKSLYLHSTNALKFISIFNLQNAVFFMDQMMYQILAQVHYMPDLWKTNANSYVVRDEFVKLFQYKFVSQAFSFICSFLVFSHLPFLRQPFSFARPGLLTRRALESDSNAVYSLILATTQIRPYRWLPAQFHCRGSRRWRCLLFLTNGHASPRKSQVDV